MDAQTLLRENLDRVYGLALRLSGNEADAWDLTQEAFLRALKALPGFRGDSAAATWLFRITVNAWKNRVRAEKRRKFWKTVTLGLITGEDGEREYVEPAAEEPAPDARLETSERDAAVQKALMTLDEDERAIVVLRELEDKSYEEIGEAMSLPQGTVKSRLFRARRS